MVTGSLLGLASGNGILEVTHAFPFPETRSERNKNSSSDADGDKQDSGLEGHEFQLEMMRMLREVNVDNNCVGWYQSMYLGIYSTSALLENQLSYQTDLSPNAVVLLYDPMQSVHGKLILKCYRLTDECLQHRLNNENTFLNPKNIFEEVPITLTNPGLIRALLADMVVTGDATASLTSNNGAIGSVTMNADTTFDRLDLSTNPYLEKHLTFLCSWVDELASEQQKFQYYARQLNQNKKGNWKNKSSNVDDEGLEEGWANVNAPRRMESLLMNNQIKSYCDQMDKFNGGSLGKLFLAGGLHKDSNKNNNKVTASSSTTPASTIN